MEKTTLLIRLTKAEKIQIQIAAALKGVSVSKFIKSKMFNKIKEENIDIFGDVDKSKLMKSKHGYLISKEDYLESINN